MTTKTTGQHTPGPWKACYHDIGDYVAHIEGRDSNHPDEPKYIRTVAVVLAYADIPENKANAAFIIHACNSHDALVGSLKALFEHCAMIHKYWGDNSNTKEADAAIKSAHATLISATEGKH